MRYPREDSDPWYKHFWLWFVITPPFVGILLGGLLVTAATYDPDGLVVDDYYQEGRGINHSIERAEFARSLGLSAAVLIEGERVWLHLNSNVTIPSDGLELTFVHPTRNHFDRTLVLGYDAGRGLHYADVNPLPEARWHLQLEPENGAWRLRGRLDALDAHEVVLQPST
ncbi:FixH family protein [Thioalkalivibrio nitratireducens DSM 14787]|uniref:FixH family protein n=1 Tax=Thioalkalivibrio nitratireducens (strain DSM 14787 / UNIQEM 213 / ALEN2) TaxID=1255043 RepID=L0DXR7_THIND|nr:FixH family protein [Thioalkalivibrio nitratireducens]AGA33838.1 FixH family protein [Thioalkalivibrio nitratireducens DSM 14787]